MTQQVKTKWVDRPDQVTEFLNEVLFTLTWAGVQRIVSYSAIPVSKQIYVIVLCETADKPAER